MNDGVLVRRVERNVPRGTITLTDEYSGNGPRMAKGVVLAVGPGKWVEGTWWKIRKEAVLGGIWHVYDYVWEWIPGHREHMEVKVGQEVMFNARWNDLAHGELKGTSCDGLGPLERPLSYRFDPTVHLVQEGDIAGILA